MNTLRNRNVTAAEVATPAVAEIPAAMQRLEHQVETVSKLGLTLVERLNDACRSLPPADPAKSGEPLPNSPLAAKITELTNALAQTSRTLESILDRVEL